MRVVIFALLSLASTTWAALCPPVVSVVYTGTAQNYGAWDGASLWIPGITGVIHKINGATQVVTNYSGFSPATGGSPLQIAWDGRYIWVGCYDHEATLYKFDPQSASIVNSWKLSPLTTANGGVQSVLWDGTNIWCGVAINSSSGYALRFNHATELVDITVTGQNNVNGMSQYIDPSGQRYILSACAGTWGKINADTGSVTQYDATTGNGYRMCNDGTYAYIAYFLNNGKTIRKFLLSTGAFVSSWLDNALLNSINFDGTNLWTVGDDHIVRESDTVGNILCTFSAGRSDVIIAGGYAWATDWTNPGAVGNVYKIGLSAGRGNIPSANLLRVPSANQLLIP